VGGGVIGGGVVVTQPTEGEFRGFSSTCTHQGCTVASVADGVISCPCHGSRFSAEDGSVDNGPATAPLPEVAVSVEGENVVRA
jgi:Rieske Fe-S protein